MFNPKNERIMRKIEKEMLRAIRERRNWKKSNTRVNIVNDWAEVFLFGNKIAQINLSNGEIHANHCGWPTRTTLSRYRALGIHVSLKDKHWRVERLDDDPHNIWVTLEDRQRLPLRYYSTSNCVRFNKSGYFLSCGHPYPEMLTDEQIKAAKRIAEIQEQKRSASAVRKRDTRAVLRRSSMWSNPNFF